MNNTQHVQQLVNKLAPDASDKFELFLVLDKNNKYFADQKTLLEELIAIFEEMKSAFKTWEKLGAERELAEYRLSLLMAVINIKTESNCLGMLHHELPTELISPSAIKHFEATPKIDWPSQLTTLEKGELQYILSLHRLVGGLLRTVLNTYTENDIETMRITTDQISLFRRLDAELDINSDDFYKNIEHELSSLCKQEVILKHPDEALKSMKQSFSEAEEVLSYFQEKLTKLQSHSD